MVVALFIAHLMHLFSRYSKGTGHDRSTNGRSWEIDRQVQFRYISMGYSTTF